jgi:hypothetical protein
MLLFDIQEKYKEYNLVLQLTQEDKDRYEYYTSKISSIISAFKDSFKLFPVDNAFLFENDFDVIRACKYGMLFSGKGNSVHISSENIRNHLARSKGWNPDVIPKDEFNLKRHVFWSPNHLLEIAEDFNYIVSSRNSIISDSYIKINAILDITNRYTIPTLCFNKTSIMVEAINITSEYFEIWYPSITSRNIIEYTKDLIPNYIIDKKGEPKKFGKTSLKKMAINKLLENKSYLLATLSHIDKELLLPNIEQIIITNGDLPIVSELKKIIGDDVLPNLKRIITLVFDNFTNSDGELINCKDITSLEKLQKLNSTNYIWINSIDEIE